VSTFVAILQDQYPLSRVSFVMRLTLLPHRLLLYKFLACQHFINYLLILFGSTVGTLSMGSIHESSSTLFLMLLLLMCHL